MSRRRKKRKFGICVYCGREELLTEDHIPPKTLYPSGLWSRLLKVPSCIECNSGASKDDEYLRTMIGLSAKGKGDDLAKPLIDAAMRALARPQAAGFRQSIVKDIKKTFVLGPAGVLVPALVGKADLERFDRVVARIIRGIFFAERGIRLSSDYSVISYSMEGLKKVPIEVARQLLALIEAVTAGDPRQIGGPQFLYWSSYYNTSNANESMWVLIIHRHHFFIGWTVKQADAMVTA